MGTPLIQSGKSEPEPTHFFASLFPRLLSEFPLPTSMKSTRSLRRQLRALWLTNLVLLAAVCLAATPATRSLFLDESNHPTTNVDFASSHWTGDPTSAKAINPASIGATTPGTGAFTTLSAGTGFTYGPLGYLGGVTGLQLQTPLIMQAQILMAYGSHIQVGDANNANSLQFNTANLAETGAGVLALQAGSGPGSLTLGTISFDDGMGYSDGTGIVHVVGLDGQDVSATEYDFLDPAYNEGAVITYSALAGFSAYTNGASGFSGNFNVQGNLAATSFSLWGVSPPATRPATPTTQAQIIAVLQAYGLCH